MELLSNLILTPYLYNLMRLPYQLCELVLKETALCRLIAPCHHWIVG